MKPCATSRENSLHYFAFDIRQAVIAPLESVGQAFVIEPRLMKQRGLHQGRLRADVGP